MEVIAGALLGIVMAALLL
ncbi:MAG: hypothetical protein M1379_00790 [Firmicutes bacterium]|nr:hypothetical protein [Bacillota bacterium]